MVLAAFDAYMDLFTPSNKSWSSVFPPNSSVAFAHSEVGWLLKAGRASETLFSLPHFAYNCGWVGGEPVFSGWVGGKKQT